MIIRNNCLHGQPHRHRANATDFVRQYGERNRFRLGKIATCVAFALSSWGMSMASAQTTAWTGAGDGVGWFDAANWSNGVPDVSTSVATIDIPTTTPLLDGNISILSLTLGVDSALTVDDSSNLDFAAGADTSLSNSGSITALNLTDFQLLNNVNNSGSITVISTGGQTDLEVGAVGATLTGGGTVTLSGVNAGINDVSGTQLLTVGDQTIQGEGNIGRNATNFLVTDAGLIDANVSSGRLILDAAASFENAGTLQASGGGILELRDAGETDFANTGTVQALDGSEVQLNAGARIVGGVLQSIGTGVVRNLASQNANLENLTFNGNLIAENASDTNIAGTITNTGTISINSTGDQTDLELAVGGATLTGGGTVTLAGGNAGINDISGTQTLTVLDQTIEGAGNIGRNTIDLNLGADSRLLANVAASNLTVDVLGAVGIISDGELSATNGATLEVIGSIDSTSTGSLTGNGTISSSTTLTIGGLVSAGESTGQLSLVADMIVFEETSVSLFEIEGIGDGDFDTLVFDAPSSVLLDGELSIDLVGFTPDQADVFTIATIFDDDGITGSFGNLLPGNLVETVGAEGTFLVNISSGSIVLSNFTSTAVPEPGAAVLLAMVGLPLAMKRRRRA